MRFEGALPHLRAGQRIHRTSWLTSVNPRRVVHPVGTRPKRDTVYYPLTIADILADDWAVWPDDAPATT